MLKMGGVKNQPIEIITFAGGKDTAQMPLCPATHQSKAVRGSLIRIRARKKNTSKFIKNFYYIS